MLSSPAGWTPHCPSQKYHKTAAAHTE